MTGSRENGPGKWIANESRKGDRRRMRVDHSRGAARVTAHKSRSRRWGMGAHHNYIKAEREIWSCSAAWKVCSLSLGFKLLHPACHWHHSASQAWPSLPVTRTQHQLGASVLTTPPSQQFRHHACDIIYHTTIHVHEPPVEPCNQVYIRLLHTPFNQARSPPPPGGQGTC